MAAKVISMGSKPTDKRKLVIRSKKGPAKPAIKDSSIEPRLSLVEPKITPAPEDRPAKLPKNRRTKKIYSAGEIPTSERLLSRRSKDEDPDNERPYLLQDFVARKVIVFRAATGATWILKSDDLTRDEYESFASTEARVKREAESYQIATCPDIIFLEFLDQAIELHKRRVSGGPSQQQEQFEALVIDASERGVSDIHITVARGSVIVEYRIDSRNVRVKGGEWAISVEQTTNFVRAVYNTITQATEDSFNSRIPQDASIVHTIDGKKYQLRYAHDNVEGDGFHVVLRVLDDLSDSEDEGGPHFVPLTKLGLYDDEVEVIERMQAAPYGFLCVSGTTGSGKSTMLKNMIGSYAHENQGKNIITVENPVEYRIFNAKQTSVSSAEKMGAHLVSAMRRDPDCILIGEIRDKQSAKVTIEATQTGHFVWSTLHASNALAQVARLEDIGISRLTLAAPEFIAGMLHLALARKLCGKCKIHIKDALQKQIIPRDRYDRVVKATDGHIEGVFVANPAGCSNCASSADIEGVPEAVDVNAGFKGRMSVPEMVLPNLEILNAFRSGDDLAAYQAWRKTGGTTIQEAAVRRMKEGHICANEIEAQFKRLDHNAEFYA